MRGSRLHVHTLRPTTPAARAARDEESTPPLKVSRLPSSGSRSRVSFSMRQRAQAFGVFAGKGRRGIRRGALGRGFQYRPTCIRPVFSLRAKCPRPRIVTPSRNVLPSGEHSPTRRPNRIHQRVEARLVGQIAHEVAQPGGDGEAIAPTASDRTGPARRRSAPPSRHRPRESG